MATGRKGTKKNNTTASSRTPAKKRPVRRKRWANEDLFRRFADTVQAAIFIYRGPKNCFVNAMAETITGYSQEELLAMNFWDILHPEFRALAKERGLKRIRGESVPSRYPVKILRKDGEERWLDFAGDVIVFEGKLAAIGTAIDITERRSAEDQVRGNLDRIRILHDINLASTSTLELKAVLDILLENIDRHFSFRSVSTIRVLNPATGSIDTAAYRNISEAEWREAIPVGGRGLSRAVLDEKIPVRVRNALDDPRTQYPDFFRRHGLVSYLGVPLIVKDGLVGDISLFTKEEHDFREEEIEFLLALANQAAIAIHNSQLYDEIKRKQAQLQEAHTQLSALFDVTSTASQSLDLDKVLQEVIQEIKQIFHFDATRVYLFDAEMDQLCLRASFETSPETFVQISVFNRGEGIVGKAAEIQQPILFEDIAGDPSYRELNPSGHLLNVGMRFFGAFPIRSKLRTLGALALGSQHVRKLTPDEVQLLSSMAAQIGIAVENATLYQETAAKARELSALYSVAGIAAQYLDVKTLLRNIMHKVLEIFDFHAARIYLNDSDKREIRLVADEGFSLDSAPPVTYQRGEGLVGRVIETGEPFVTQDMQSDSEYNRWAKKKRYLKAGFRSTILIPIKVRGETLGVMNFLSREVHSFTPSEIQLIKSIAYHLGIAVGNANLFFQLNQRTAELERANKGKDEFLSVMSHELRTPLNIIMGFAGMLGDGVLGELNTEQQNALEKVTSYTRELLNMVNGILQVASLQAGMVEVENREVSLKDFCDTLKMSYDLSLSNAVKLQWEYAPDLPVTRTDSEKLKQILRNLIDNALKFTQRGEVVVRVIHAQEGKRLEFKVTDSGIGIAPEMIPSIFEMFRQVDSSETRPFGGVGLGLYIAKQFTDLLGGQITVESEVGRGSTFTVNIPFCPSQL